MALDNTIIQQASAATTNTLHQAGAATSQAVEKTVAHYSGIYAPVDKLIDQFMDRIPYLIASCIVLVLFWLLARLFKLVIKRTLTHRVQKRQNLVKVLNRIGSTTIIFIGVLIAMVVAIPGFTTTKLVSALGIGSVAIGFAFKDIFQNMLSGILILLSEPFRIGDQIIMGSFEGTVEDIQIRATYIRTYDGRRIVIPNAQLYTTPVTVNTAFRRRRNQIDIGIGMGDDVGVAKTAILEALKKCDTVTANSNPTIVATGFSDFALILRLRWWIEDSAQMDITDSMDQVLIAIKYALTDAGIDLPYPTSQVLLHDQTEETDGDRLRQREGWPARADQKNPRSLVRARYDLRRSERELDLPADRGVRTAEPAPSTRDESESANPQRD
ncbi:mechanosensitive ion channel family protein [Aquirhabdus parva]|uniref:Small-conductance mechanosensitive channel n=1 Tax=Aquirhabdus parva TaxID=2283318 RepID=A0A345P3J7_9GAMM|nr:mechanosensitive ion channel family protein [Aquirhabdus parva]AXI01856.1 mechanosensitive ion channel family protein [Aquirhabdus parva]